MEKIDVRRGSTPVEPKPSGGRGQLQRLGPHPPGFEGRLQFRRDSTTAVDLGQHSGHLPTPTCPIMRARFERLTRPVAASAIDGTRSRSPGGKGQEHRVASRSRSPSLDGPIRKQYPLQKKRHSFEKLREWAHLRPRTNTFGAVARVRNAISARSTTSSSRAGLPLRPHAGDHGQRLRGRRRDVQGHHARPGQCSPSSRLQAVDFTQDFFDRPAS